MMTNRTILATVLALLATAPACAEDAAAPPPAAPRGAGPDQPDSPWAQWKHDPALAACHASARARDDLPVGVVALGEACAAAGRMRPIGQIVVGTQQAHAPAFEIPVHVEADHCYRAYGMGAFSLLDLNLAFVDSLGRSAGGDDSHGPIAVALEDGAVCFSQADDVKVNVSSGNGGGKFAVAIWSD
jgi:hypothetical protein